MRAAIVALLTVVSAGCGGVRSGTFDVTGFRHSHYEYRVRNDANGALLNGWNLENYQVDSSGHPSHLKRTARHVRRLRRDVTGDGVPNDLGEYPVDDLHFRSVRTAGAIWLRTLPLPAALEHTELRVLARMYVDAVSGAGLEVVELSPGRAIGTERRFATRDVRTVQSALDGREAFQVLFEVASVDQVQGGGEPAWERVHLVLVRTHLLFHARSRTGVSQLPVLMIAGYANLPEDFAREHTHFHGFLSRIQLETELVRRMRPVVLSCVPDAEVVRFVITRSISLAHGGLRGPDLAPYVPCLAAGLRGIELGTIDEFRSFAIPRYIFSVTPAAPPPTALPPAAGVAEPTPPLGADDAQPPSPAPTGAGDAQPVESSPIP